MKKTSNEIVSKLYINKNQENWKEHNSITSRIRENKSALITQIRIENVKLTNFLYKRRVSNINLSTCLCDHQKQIMKHVIVSCSQHNRIEIKNEKESINYRNFINTAAELKKFTRWVMKLRILIRFTVAHKHLHSISD